MCRDRMSATSAIHDGGSQPSFSLTSANIAVAMLTTINVAIAPNGIRLGKFPDGEDAQNGAGHERGGDHDKRDPPDDLRI